MWTQLVSTFRDYCAKIDVDISKDIIEEFILRVLDDSDNLILSGYEMIDDHGLKPEEYAWYSFVKNQAEECSQLYSFIAAISASNITKQALFFVGDSEPNFSGLNVYLDSPIVFALLGMDDEARTMSYKKLVGDMIHAGCNVQVLDNDFQEVDGIITRAATWATSAEYDIRKANNAARFFHDSRMSETEITEFCENLESYLNKLSIAVKSTNYDVYQDKFQEDENTLFEMIKSKYSEQGRHLSDDQERSILVDVRSIVMVYRERQGQASTRIETSKHLMLTSNNAIANISKQYESNRSIQAGHIPACISADLFGTILWLSSPLQMAEYHKYKLLADCYRFLRPNRIMLDKYIQSLDEARAIDEIDEKKYLFLRTHPVVLDSLMNITRGDYARFNSNTYLEVYADIEARAMKKYDDEVIAHRQTLAERDADKKTIRELNSRIEALENTERERKQRSFSKRVKILWIIITALFCVVPCFVVTIVIEIIPSMLPSIFSGVTKSTVICTAVLVAATSVIGILNEKGKAWCHRLAERCVTRWDSTHDK